MFNIYQKQLQYSIAKKEFPLEPICKGITGNVGISPKYINRFLASEFDPQTLCSVTKVEQCADTKSQGLTKTWETGKDWKCIYIYFSIEKNALVTSSKTIDMCVTNSNHDISFENLLKHVNGGSTATWVSVHCLHLVEACFRIQGCLLHRFGLPYWSSIGRWQP